MATLRKILARVRDEGIKEVVLLGDVLDKPTVSVILLMRLAAFFNEYRDLKFIWILGNHDKTSAESSQVDLLRYMAELGALPHVRIVSKPLRRKGVGYLPYPYAKPLPGTNLSYAHVDRPMARTDSGRVLRKDGKWYHKHRFIIGHIHTEQTLELTDYLGAPYQLSWGEMGDKWWAIAEYDANDPKTFRLRKHLITPEYRLVNLEVHELADLKALTPPKDNIYYRILLRQRVTLPRNLLLEFPNAHLDGGLSPLSTDSPETQLMTQAADTTNPLIGLRAGLRRKGFKNTSDLKWARNEIRQALGG